MRKTDSEFKNARHLSIPRGNISINLVSVNSKDLMLILTILLRHFGVFCTIMTGNELSKILPTGKSFSLVYK